MSGDRIGGEEAPRRRMREKRWRQWRRPKKGEPLFGERKRTKANSRAGRPQGRDCDQSHLLHCPGNQEATAESHRTYFQPGTLSRVEHVRFIDLALFVPRRTSPTKTTLPRAEPCVGLGCVNPDANPSAVAVSSCDQQARIFFCIANTSYVSANKIIFRLTFGAISTKPHQRYLLTAASLFFVFLRIKSTVKQTLKF